MEGMIMKQLITSLMKDDMLQKIIVIVQSVKVKEKENNESF